MMRTQLFSSAMHNIRRGLTIIEVLFAIGVTLVGLMGIAFLIPIAAENANSSIRVDAAVRYGTSASAELQARNIGSLSGLLRFDLDPANDDGLGAAPPNSPAVAKPIKVGRAIVPADSPSMVATFGFRPGNLSAFCIDPLFLAQNQTTAEFQTLATTRNAYQRDRFPYYSEFYTGLTAPNKQPSGLTGGFPIPRMWRASFAAPSPGGAPTRFIAPQIAQWLTSSTNDLSFAKADDRLDPRGQVVDVLTFDQANSSIIASRRQTENRFSWFATLTPSLDGSRNYRMSTVVVEQRNFVEGPTKSGEAPYTATSPRNNAESERVVLCRNGLSFGSVLEVDVHGSVLMSDDIVSNQWVMLSRQPHITLNNGNKAPHGSIPASHTWYRVIQVGEPVPSADFPDCWTRHVVLDGPTWSFASITGAPQGDDTYMTIVDGAVAVIEADIRIQ